MRIFYTTARTFPRGRGDEAIVVNTRLCTVSRAGTTIRLTRCEHRLVACLLAAKVVPYWDLVQALHGDDPSGGPINPRRLRDVYITRMRRRLAEIGVRIETIHGIGTAANIGPMPTVEFARAA